MSQIRNIDTFKIGEKASKSTLLTLPAELVFKILVSLNFDDCQRVKETCKHLQRIVHSLYDTQGNGIIEVFKNSSLGFFKNLIKQDRSLFFPQ